MSSDPYDAILDARAEAAHHGIYLTTPQMVRHALDYEAEYSHLNLGRHPFGLPPVAVSPGDAPVGLRSVSPPPAGAQADGHPLPNAA